MTEEQKAGKIFLFCKESSQERIMKCLRDAFDVPGSAHDTGLELHNGNLNVTLRIYCESAGDEEQELVRSWSDRARGHFSRVETAVVDVKTNLLYQLEGTESIVSVDYVFEGEESEFLTEAEEAAKRNMEQTLFRVLSDLRAVMAFRGEKRGFYCLDASGMEKLILDGRIHPARIEETVEKCRHDLELQMKREGEKAVMELGIHGLHPDLIKLIGRLKYRTSFGQNALTHSMEVAWLAGLLAGEMGVNVTLARRAGLLHDIGKALDHEIEGSHVQIGVDICRKYKENTQVIHAIEAHHGDVEPKTPLAFIIQACDAISAARPGARRENVESYVKRLENLEEISSSFEGVEQAFAVQAGREVRIMVKPDVISDDQVILLARSIAKKIEDTLDYPGQIKVNVIRESRAVEYAK